MHKTGITPVFLLTRITKCKPERIPTQIKVVFCKIYQNKQHHGQVLLISFMLTGHTIGFQPQTETSKPNYG